MPGDRWTSRLTRPRERGRGPQVAILDLGTRKSRAPRPVCGPVDLTVDLGKERTLERGGAYRRIEPARSVLDQLT